MNLIQVLYAHRILFHYLPIAWRRRRSAEVSWRGRGGGGGVKLTLIFSDTYADLTLGGTCDLYKTHHHQKRMERCAPLLCNNTLQYEHS